MNGHGCPPKFQGGLHYRIRQGTLRPFQFTIALAPPRLASCALLAIALGWVSLCAGQSTRSIGDMPRRSVGPLAAPPATTAGQPGPTAPDVSPSGPTNGPTQAPMAAPARPTAPIVQSGAPPMAATGQVQPFLRGDEVRVRIAWGGGAARQWMGRILIHGAQITNHRVLGLAAHSPGSLRVGANEVSIQQRFPQSYDGVDLTLRGDLHSSLRVELKDIAPRNPKPGEPEEDAAPKTTVVEVELSEVVNSFRNEKLDEEGNQLLVRRQPGDWLRLGLPAPQPSIYSPGQQLTFTPAVHHSGFEPKTTCRLRASLRKAGGGREVWDAERGFVTDEQGSAVANRPFELTLPTEEGVYDLQLVATEKRIVGAPFWRNREERRTLQIVVMQEEPLDPVEQTWRIVDTIDPANPSWRQWVNRLPGVRNLPGFDPAMPLGNDRLKPTRRLGQDWVQLKAEGWQAFPLPTRGKGPHIVEVEYPADTAQTLGISVLQSNLANYLAPPNLDSGVHVDPTFEQFEEDADKVRTVRLVFWPHRAGPMLMLTNHQDRPATFGKIRVYSGPDALAGPSPMPRGRMTAALFEKPLFPENFGAQEAYEKARETTLDDWATFYDGGKRLTEYLDYAGYNAAIVNVLREGGSLYPSKLLEPTPRFDSGVFFVTGQDSGQKDVLEMMFRMFDRQGLRLIPSIHFSGTLPALERLRGADPGLELMGAEGRPIQNGTLPPYNPLNPKVREAMRQVVAELVARYGHHRSFGGVAVQLAPDSYAQLPNEFWGLDDDTVRRFEEATGAHFQADGEQRFVQRASQIRGKLADSWIRWRASEMTKLYRLLSGEVRRHRLDTRLVLVTTDMFNGAAAQKALVPRLLREPPVQHTALRLGIDAQQLRGSSQDIVLLQPQRSQARPSLSDLGLMESLGPNTSMKTFFGQASTVNEPFGLVIREEPLVRTLPQFDRVSPYGPNRSYTEIRSLCVDGGPASRRQYVRHLAVNDHQWIVHGGDMLPMGQETYTRPWLRQFASLPEAQFQPVTPKTTTQIEPLLARHAIIGPRRCVYFLNESPWPVPTTITFSLPAGAQVLDGFGDPVAVEPSPKDKGTWQLTVPAYGLQVIWLTSPNAEVLDWQTSPPESGLAVVKQQLSEVSRRAQQLRTPDPLQTVVNADFDDLPVAAQQTKGIPGWQVVGQGGVARLDREVFKTGSQSLQLASQANGRVRVVSAPFPAPTTGKVYFFAWMKIANAETQPKLQVMLRGDNGYYSYLYVGAGQRFRLGDEWQEGFLFPFEQIPSNVQNLTLEFTLIGSGNVWIDGITPYDYWFIDPERLKLIHDVGGLNFALGENGKVSDSLRFLNGYWARFLLDHVPPAPKAIAGRQAPNPAPENNNAPRTARNPVGRIRDLVPPLKLPKLR